MSSSESGQRPPGSARVIVGLGSTGPHETTVAEIEARRSPLHFEEVEAKFWERVREKAGAKAKEILAQAMAEAEELKAKAKEEGYQEGMSQSAADYEAHIGELTAAVSETLSSVQAERKSLWAGYREDFGKLLKLAVERTIGAELDARREELAKSLLDEALDLIDARTNLTARVQPDAAGLFEELLNRAMAAGMRLERWRVKPDPSVAMGGVILESADGMVDNTVGSRWAEVEGIFDGLAVGAELEAEPAVHPQEAAPADPQSPPDPSGQANPANPADPSDTAAPVQEPPGS